MKISKHLIATIAVVIGLSFFFAPIDVKAQNPLISRRADNFGTQDVSGLKVNTTGTTLTSTIGISAPVVRFTTATVTSLFLPKSTSGTLAIQVDNRGKIGFSNVLITSVTAGMIGPDLAAIEALTGTGGLYRIAVNSWALRTFANSSEVAWTNPAGIAGNPSAALINGSVANARLVNSSITIGGQSTALGGTVTADTILDSITTNVGSLLTRRSGGWSSILPGTAGESLVSNGPLVNASFQNVSLTAGVTGTLPIANGGTGQTTALPAFNALSPLTTQGDLLYFDGSNNARLAKNASASRYLSNSGSSNNPAWAQVDLTNGVTGTLPAANLPGSFAGFANPTATLTASFQNGSAPTAMRSDAAPKLPQALDTTATPTFGGATLTGSVPVLDITNSPLDSAFRVVPNGGVTYVQAGTSSSDTGANLTIARRSTTNVNLAQFNVFSAASAFNGTISAASTVNATTGYKINSAAASGTFPIGNGTNYVTSTLILPNAITAGSVVYGSATNTYGQDNANFFWDGTNHRLGVGTTTPASQMEVANVTRITGNSGFSGFGSGGPAMELFYDQGGQGGFVNAYDRSAGTLKPLNFFASSYTFFNDVTTAFSGKITQTTAGLAPLSVASTDAGAAASVVDFYRNSASPAANDVLTANTFSGNSSTGVKRTYASITASISSATNGAENGQLDIGVIKGGTAATSAPHMRFIGNGAPGIENFYTTKMDQRLTLGADLVSAGASTSAANGAATGTGGSVSIDGNDVSGVLTINSGTIGMSTGVLATMTFGAGNGPSTSDVVIFAGNAAAGLAAVSGNFYVVGSNTGWTLNTNVALGISGVYKVNYVVIKR